MTEAEQVHLWALLARANEEQREFVAQVKRLRETALTTADVVKRLSQLVVGLPEADRRRLGTEFVQAVVAGGFSGDLWRRPGSSAAGDVRNRPDEPSENAGHHECRHCHRDG